jgi:hypothetical protein
MHKAWKKKAVDPTICRKGSIRCFPYEQEDLLNTEQLVRP